MCDATETVHPRLDDASAELAKFRAREGHQILDLLLHRYLWGSVATAQALLVLGQAERVRGSKPLHRYLFECLVDLHYLLTEDDPDRWAARALAWDILEWDRMWDRHDAVADEDLEMEINVQGESPDEAAYELADRLRAMGEEPTVFETEYEEGRRQGEDRRSHWSGISTTDRVNRIAERTPDNPLLAAMYHAMWFSLSEGTHPPPGLVRIPLRVSGDGVFDAPAPTGGASCEEVSRVMNSTAAYLEGIPRAVEQLRREEA